MITRADQFWFQALANPGTEVDIGRLVVCDGCSKDYTDLPDAGGMIFLSRALCRACAEKWMPDIIANSEQYMIRGMAGPGQAFADFVREFRGPHGNTICIIPPQPKEPFQ